MSIQLFKRAFIATLFMSPGFLLFPQIVTAKSGCCSSHDGVNCSAGPQANGNVICNDGSTGSSCAYSEMVMCGGSLGSNETVDQEPKHQQARPIMYIPPTAFPTQTPTRVPTEVPTPTHMPTATIASIQTPEEIRDKDEVVDSPSEPTPPPTVGETATGLGIMGGMGYGAYWGGKKLLGRLLRVFH